ncbi:MAG TPA: hypothetical protein VE912_09375 [Bacteroidales bacterium]|nr:hypothetical protein [Bacteroidales bacterium]
MKIKSVFLMEMGCLKLTYYQEEPTLKVVHRADEQQEKVVQWFLSVDPLAEKFPSISSYAYVANNPLNAIDPDGREIKLILGRDKNGTVTQMVTYRNGNLYSSDGTVYNSNKPFALTVQYTLKSLSGMKNETVRSVVNQLETSDNIHYIEQDPYGGDRVSPVAGQWHAANEGTGVDTHMKLTLDGEPIEGDLETSPETTLGHELKHAYDLDQGNYKGQMEISPSNKSPKEISAVNFENKIRHERDMEIRTSYGNKEIDKTKLEDPSK